MRFVPFALLLAISLPGAEFGFKTGQGARLVIGQPTFTAQDAGATEVQVGGVSGLAYVNNTLMVTDANRLNATPLNHRVLLFNNVSGKFPPPTAELPVRDDVRCQVCVGNAEVALGQKSLIGGDQQATNADTVRVPVGIASDGSRIAVADTDNNRILIWNQIPTTSGQPANVVIGQTDFTKAGTTSFNPTSQSLKGPQGVWIQNGKLFVADTGNNRVLIWNSIPSQNNAAADVVLGQKDFTSFVQPDLTQTELKPTANTLLTPASVTSDGTRLYVADLGHNRVLIWNSIPTQNEQPADVVIGQPDMDSAIANNSSRRLGSLDDETLSPVLCESNGTDANGRPTFPPRCSATLEFPRFALSDGQMLFIADAGNDRVLVFNKVPTRNGEKADAVLGQINDQVNLVSDSAFPEDVASAGTVRTPLSLAWDGINLYVSDPFNRRIMVFTMAEQRLPRASVRNAASIAVFAVGTVTLDGEVTKDNEVTITIGATDAEDKREYKYKAVEGDDFDDVINGLAAAVNAGNGDPQVFATPNPDFQTVLLTARVGGEIGNQIAYSAAVSEGATITVTTGGANLAGGEEASKIAPGTTVSLFGEQLSDGEFVAPADGTELPRELGGVEVYFDGIRAPLYYVSPTRITAQMPVEVYDAQSSNAYVRTVHSDGSIVASNAVAVPVIQFNPGIFAGDGPDPRPAVALHYSSQATGTILIGGQTKAGEEATVIIQGERRYTYTVQPEDVPPTDQPPRLGYEKVRDGLIALINEDPEVRAEATGIFATRILLYARIPGPAGNGITFATETKAPTGEPVLTLSASGTELCCAGQGGAPITENNPAIAGETISIFSTGLGLVQPEAARLEQKTGVPYSGPPVNEPVEFVSGLAGGRTANVLSARLVQGRVGLFEVVLQLNSGLPTNPRTDLTIAQGFQVSNIVSIPVFQPNPE